jgi:hypothetical protein
MLTMKSTFALQLVMANISNLDLQAMSADTDMAKVHGSGSNRLHASVYAEREEISCFEVLGESLSVTWTTHG